MVKTDKGSWGKREAVERIRSELLVNSLGRWII